MRRVAFEPDARKPVQTGHLDQGLDLRLGTAQEQSAPAHAQPPCEHGEIEHERGVSERKLGQVDDDVGLRTDCSGQSAPAITLR
jgi:hypothetical protein